MYGMRETSPRFRKMVRYRGLSVAPDLVSNIEDAEGLTENILSHDEYELSRKNATKPKRFKVFKQKFQ